MRVTSLASYVRSIARQIDHWQGRSGSALEPVFRGHADRRWDLVPSLLRGVTFDKLIEDSLLDEFQRAARPFLHQLPTTSLQWMALAQHHGLPTRLLDFSESALVALFFALHDVHLPSRGRRKRADACVWMLNRKALHERLGAAEQLILLDSPSRSLPDPLAAIAQAEAGGAFVFTPVHLSARMPMQKAAFVLFGNDAGALEQLRGDPSLMKQFVIPREHALAMRRELETAGITYATLFPGLDGIAREVWEREVRRRSEQQDAGRAHSATRAIDEALTQGHRAAGRAPVGAQAAQSTTRAAHHESSG